MDVDFLDARITSTQALIVAYEAAILALSSKTTHSFTLNTGEALQTVTHKDTAKLQSELDALYNRLAVLEARRNGAVVQVRPGW
jgi:hypothetical protein